MSAAMSIYVMYTCVYIFNSHGYHGLLEGQENIDQQFVKFINMCQQSLTLPQSGPVQQPVQT